MKGEIREDESMKVGKGNGKVNNFKEIWKKEEREEI